MDTNRPTITEILEHEKDLVNPHFKGKIFQRKTGGSTGMIIEGEQGTPELGITFDDQYKQDDTGGDAPPPQPEGEDVST